MVRIPVAVIVFNRPDHTNKLLKKLAKFKFKKLIFIADGPRNVEERVRCNEVRKLINIDWGCDVEYLISEENMGCKNRVVSGLDYVFEKHESAIILEDDCIPADTFFEFCEEVINQYRNDKRILMACGTVLVEPANNPFKYFFSQLPHIWGWASWRDRWKQYKKDVVDYNQFLKLNKQAKYYPVKFTEILCEKLKKVEKKQLDTWDAQMTYLAVSQNLLSVFPNQNLISNIGFGYEATHTTDPSVLSDIRVGTYDGKGKVPTIILPQRKTDEERMLVEGHAGMKIVRFVRIIFRKNGSKHVKVKLLKMLNLIQ